jgi:hypothetical protein
LKRFALDLELSALVGDRQVAFVFPVVVVFLVHPRETIRGEVHLSLLVLGDIPKHQPPHAWIQFDDFRHLLLGKMPTPQNTFTLFRCRQCFLSNWFWPSHYPTPQQIPIVCFSPHSMPGRRAPNNRITRIEIIALIKSALSQ